jgi:hypothetical protein
MLSLRDIARTSKGVTGGFSVINTFFGGGITSPASLRAQYARMPRTLLPAQLSLCQRPSTSSASAGPGQLGMVAMINVRGSAPVLRNWKCSPGSMVRYLPGLTSTVSSFCTSPALLRHTCPSPCTKYQISPTVLCRCATETWPVGSTQCARPPFPPSNSNSSRISLPSGAK